MANFCMNEVMVSGPKEEVISFVQAFGADPKGSGEFLEEYFFSNLYPSPSGLDDREEMDWRKDNWGVSRDLDYGEVGIMVNPDTVNADILEVVFVFETHWYPVVKWTGVVAAQWSKLNFCIHYLEPGMMFSGTVSFVNGVLSYDKFYSSQAWYSSLLNPTS